MSGIPDPSHRLFFKSVSGYVVEKKFFYDMIDQNSTPNNSIRPEALQAELSIKKATYYDDLSHLGIRADKDAEGKAYLTFEQAEQVRALRSYVSEKGTRKGFVYQ